jgi:hypothetical protein
VRRKSVVAVTWRTNNPGGTVTFATDAVMPEVCTGVMTVDGKELARKTIPQTIPFLMPIDESFDIGSDTRTGVNDDYKIPASPGPSTS